MDEWCLRLNEYDGYYDQLCTMFDDDLFKWVCVVHHTGKKKENPHYHAVFKTIGITKKQLQDLIVTRFTKAKGNKNYSLVLSDGSVKTKSYLFHEDTPVEYSKNLTPEELEEFQVVNLQIQNEVKENTPNKIIDRVYQALQPQRYPPRPEIVFACIMKDLMSRGEWIPNKFQMERWINRIRAQFAIDTGTQDQFIRILYAEMFPMGVADWSKMPVAPRNDPVPDYTQDY